ncbi:MAG: hypothetical protein ACOC3C_02085, partial [Candidatus Thorarchaeota archaeon]
FQHFRAELDIEQAYTQALSAKYQEEDRQRQDVEAEFFSALEACIKALTNIPLRLLRDAAIKDRVKEQIENLEKAVKPIKEY